MAPDIRIAFRDAMIVPRIDSKLSNDRMIIGHTSPHIPNALLP
jgi:hypothetical protein